MREPPPEHFESADGRWAWSAFAPEGQKPAPKDEAWEGPPDGATIRFMGEDRVEVPLWTNEIGLIFSDSDELIEHWGVSSSLAADMAAWGDEWDRSNGDPAFRAQGQSLVERLDAEMGGRFRFVYRP